MQVIEEIKAGYEQEMQELLADPCIYIVNAGTMNNGKSSLFNSFLGEEVFEVKDFRTTTVNREYATDIENVYYIDTPGLGARDEDSEEAYRAYEKAHLILFVHNLNTGSLTRSEVDELRKIQELYFNPSIFWENLILVFTHKDDCEEDETARYENIRAKVLDEITKELGFDGDITTFAVDNLTYMEGIRGNEPILIQDSGINELKRHVAIRVGGLQNDLERYKAAQILRTKAKYLEKVKVAIEEQQKAYEEIKAAAVQEYEPVSRQLRDLRNSLRETTQKMLLLDTKINSTRAKIDYLKLTF